MNSRLTDVCSEPWYRQGWPWFLIAVPATSVVLGTAMLFYAEKSFDGRVADDYQKEGPRVVKLVDKSERARSLGLSARMSVGDGEVSVELTAAQEKDLPEVLYLTIVHPTRDRLDQEAVLQRGQDGLYSGAINPLQVGRWRFQLENEKNKENDKSEDKKGEPQPWRMDGVANLPTETVVFIKPSDS